MRLLRKGFLLVSIVSVVATTSSAAAQSTIHGRFVGVVRDSEGGRLPGVAVTLTGSGVIGQRTVASASDGSYVHRAVPPGTYQLRFELAGFQSEVREELRLSIGTTLTVSPSLELAGFEESVVVRAQSPTIDIQTTRLGATFDEAELQDVPSATDLWAVLAQSPGIRMQGYDVGGSHKRQQTVWESFGIRADSRVVSEGVDSTEERDGAGLYYDYYAIEEFQTSTSGADVEMTSPGASVVMTVKSGGNELSGLVHADYEDERFVGDNTDAALDERGFTGNPNLRFYEFHADLGGPIARDRAWFFGAYNRFEIEQAISGQDPDVATARGIFDNVTFKVNAAPGERDRLIGYSQWGFKEEPGTGLSLLRPLESTFDRAALGRVHKLEWQRFWSDRAFTSVQLKHYGGKVKFRPRLADFVTNPPRRDDATGISSGSSGGVRDALISKPQLSAQGVYYVADWGGSHDFKIGVDVWRDAYRRDDTGSDILYIDDSDLGRPNDVNVVSLRNIPFGSDDRVSQLGVYLQDIWTPNDRLSLSLGVRINRQHAYFEAAELIPRRSDLFPPRSIDKTSLVTWFRPSPRLGAAFDVTGAGRTVAKAYWGRFYVNMGRSFARANPSGFRFKIFDFLDPNENGIYDGPEELGRLFFDSGGVEGTPVTPDLTPSFGDELSFSLEHELAPDTSVRASYVRKTLRNDFGIWNPAQELPLRAAGIPCGDTGFPCPLDSFSGAPIRIARVPDDAAFAFDTVIDTFPDARYTYDTIVFAGSRRWTGRLFVQGSFDFQWRDELRSPFATTNPLSSDPLPVGGNQGGTFWQNHSLDVGYRQKSTTWQARLLGRYVLPRDVGLAVNFRHQSGWPWAPVHRVRIPGSGNQLVFLEDIDQNRSEHVVLLDVRVDKALALGDGHRLTLMADVYNLINSNAETNFVLGTGGSFRDIIAALHPRTLKLGVRWEF